MDAENPGNFEDADGDQIADDQDACPSEDDDGCPDRELVVVRTAGVIVEPERVYFASGSTTIPTEAGSLLDAIAAVLRDHPELTLVEVQGHADGRGTADEQLRVSRARAEAVLNEIIARGIDPGRLRAVGYGAACPIASENSAEGRARNRRAELFVVRREGADRDEVSPCAAAVDTR